MTTTRHKIGIAAIAILSFGNSLFLPYTASAQGPAAAPWASLDFGGQFTEEATGGEVDALIPLPIDSAGNLFFLNLRSSADDIDQEFGSAGIGYRHFFADSFLGSPVILGLSGHYDYLDSRYGNKFHQFGPSLEILSDRVDLRVNGYLPFGDEEIIDSQRTSSTFTDTRTDQVGRYSVYSDPYATSHEIRQDQFLGVIEQTTTTTTVIDQLFRNFEQAMEGVDGEIGLRLFGDVRVYGGYEYFENPFGGSNFEGFKGRLEARILPGLILEGGYYEEDRLRGSDWSAGVRVNIPLAKDGLKMAFTPRVRDFSERFYEKVARQSIRTTESGYREVQSARKVQQSFERETSRRIVGRRALVIEDQIIFVDNVRGTPGASGRYEDPVDTISEGAGLAKNRYGTGPDANDPNWIVYTQETGVDYIAAFDPLDLELKGLRMTSSAIPIISPFNGAAYGGNTVNPVVSGEGAFSFSNPTTLTIQGYSFNNVEFNAATPGAISIFNPANNPNIDPIQEIIISQNTFENLNANPDHTGIYLSSTSAVDSTISITQNQFLGAITQGVRAEYAGPNSYRLGITENTFDHLGIYSVRATAADAATLSVSLQENTFTGNLTARAIDIGSFNTSAVNTLIAGNQFDLIDSMEYLFLQANDGSTLASTITQNTLAGNASNAAVRADSNDSAILNLTINGANLFSGTSQSGIDLSANGESELNTLIAQNRFTGNFTQGIRGRSSGIADIGFEVAENEFIGNFTQFGISLELTSQYAGLDPYYILRDNTITNAPTGIEIEGGSPGGPTDSIGQITGNTISNFTDNGIHLRGLNQHFHRATLIQGNTLLGNGGSETGILATRNTQSDFNLNIIGNLFRDLGTGISIEENGTIDAGIGAFILISQNQFIGTSIDPESAAVRFHASTNGIATPTAIGFNTFIQEENGVYTGYTGTYGFHLIAEGNAVIDDFDVAFNGFDGATLGYGFLGEFKDNTQINDLLVTTNIFTDNAATPVAPSIDNAILLLLSGNATVNNTPEDYEVQIAGNFINTTGTQLGIGMNMDDTSEIQGSVYIGSNEITSNLNAIRLAFDDNSRILDNLDTATEFDIVDNQIVLTTNTGPAVGVYFMGDALNEGQILFRSEFGTNSISGGEYGYFFNTTSNNSAGVIAVRDTIISDANNGVVIASNGAGDLMTVLLNRVNISGFTNDGVFLQSTGAGLNVGIADSTISSSQGDVAIRANILSPGANLLQIDMTDMLLTEDGIILNAQNGPLAFFLNDSNFVAIGDTALNLEGTAAGTINLSGNNNNNIGAGTPFDENGVVFIIGSVEIGGVLYP